jgi:hypothetical protein
MDNDQKISKSPEPPLYHGQRDICVPGTAWTCTIQCAPGTRGSVERILNFPGVEVCTVSGCECRQLPPAFESAVPVGSVFDVALPLAFVIFSAEYMMRGPLR